MNHFFGSVVAEIAPVEHKPDIMLACSLVGWLITRSNLVDNRSADYQKRDECYRAPNEEEPFEYFPSAIHFILANDQAHL